MKKSIYAIGGMGVVACVMLSLMMQHLLEVRKDHTTSPIGRELEDLLGGRISEPIQVAAIEIDGKRALDIHVTLKNGVEKQRTVTAAGKFLWLQLMSDQDAPETLIFHIGDEAGGNVELVEVPRPRMAPAPPPPRQPKTPATPPQSK